MKLIWTLTSNPTRKEDAKQIDRFVVNCYMVISDVGAVSSSTGLTQNNFLPPTITQLLEDGMVSIASGIHDNHKRGPVGGFLFLFGEPGFIRSLDPDKTVKKFFKIVDEHLELAKRLKHKQVAKECADWIRSRVNM